LSQDLLEPVLVKRKAGNGVRRSVDATLVESLTVARQGTGDARRGRPSDGLAQLDSLVRTQRADLIESDQRIISRAVQSKKHLLIAAEACERRGRLRPASGLGWVGRRLIGRNNKHECRLVVPRNHR